MKLRDLGEDGLIQKIRGKFGLESKDLVVGIGDDAAVFDLPQGCSAVFCSDLVAENTHFIRRLHPPASVSYKAIAANVSDVAAMGGEAKYFVISLAAPGDVDVEWLDDFYSGVEAACRAFHVSLAGGDTSVAESIFVDVAMIGWVRSGQAVRRSGARVGDGVYVTGQLGSSALGLELLQAGEMNDAAVRRHLFPEPRRAGLSLAGVAHAMIDVSDGLSTDLSHILQDSNVSARIYKDRLPAWPGAQDRHVLHGGEEYELIIVAPDLPESIDGVRVTRIGEIVEARGRPELLLVDDGSESVLTPKGWQHFRV